ncbi:DUF4342 domain-containing protein [Enemella dayhoffiae]|nr:DUF4342 domain-containing protein [Enemella dayhoffiae]
MSNDRRTFTERIEVSGGQLADKIKELVSDASARSVVIRDRSGRELLRMPLALGVAGGAFALFTAPVIATVAAIGGTLARVRLDVERVTPADDDH